MERKLASIRRIQNIEPISGADLIVAASIGGWKVIVKKDEFKVGDLAIYFEIDSFLPPNPVYDFLRSRCLKVLGGKEGYRIKTMKMKGVVSQGFLLPTSSFVIENLEEGLDVTELLGVVKYEVEENEPGARLGGKKEGNFPGFIPKTDEERVQNLDINQILGKNLEITEKLDGSSLTIYKNGDHFGVCSRNYELKDEEGNTFWKVAKKYDLQNKLESLGLNIALQGELVGPGVQKNKYKREDHEFYVFKIWNIDEQRMCTQDERLDLVKELSIPHVPIVGKNTFSQATIDDILKMAEEKSLLNPLTEREGIVFKDVNSGFSFKAISNKFLLKHDL